MLQKSQKNAQKKVKRRQKKNPNHIVGVKKA